MQGAARTVPAWAEQLDANVRRGGRRGPPTKYWQLATASAEGLPSCRTIVFRGFLHGDQPGGALVPEGSCPALKFVTDRRSKKVADIAGNPRGEVAAYFDKSREQYRIRGSLLLVGAEEAAGERGWDVARRSQWGQLSDAAKAQFLWPEPGAAREAVPEGGEDPHAVAAGSDTPVPDDFLLLVLVPDRVDVLSLRDNERHVSTLDGEAGWQVVAVNP